MRLNNVRYKFMTMSDMTQRSRLFGDHGPPQGRPQNGIKTKYRQPFSPPKCGAVPINNGVVGRDSTMKDKVIEMHPIDPKRRGWVPVKDDACRWVLDLPGGPFVVLPCDVCNVAVEISSTPNQAHHRVECPNCGKHTPEVLGGQLLDVLQLWNEMVDRD
jgi:predicted RNA-binding Zn-ribbon protein involved in translation (DUF1610 family)